MPCKEVSQNDHILSQSSRIKLADSSQSPASACNLPNRLPLLNLWAFIAPAERQLERTHAHGRHGMSKMKHDRSNCVEDELYSAVFPAEKRENYKEPIGTQTFVGNCCTAGCLTLLPYQGLQLQWDWTLPWHVQQWSGGLECNLKSKWNILLSNQNYAKVIKTTS